MRADLLDVPIGAVVYRTEEPQLRDGLKVTVTVLDADGCSLHADRLNLDRAPARQRFAEAAGVPVADLLILRTTLMTALTPPAGEVGAVGAPPVAADDPAALALLDAPDLMDHMAATVQALGYAGNLWLVRLVYLVLTSRLLPRPLNLVVSGPSAAGKTFTVGLVAGLCPAEATYFLSGMSARVLVYTDADLRHRHLIIGEASALEQEGIGASLLRNVAWEGRLVYETVERVDGKMQPRRIEKEGPTGFITTTTGRVEAELETRTLTVTVDDTPAATRTIITATAHRANGRAPAAPDLGPWHAAQAWLAAHGDRAVTLPYAERLGALVPARQVRMRRDFPQLLTLVQTHALLHQRQRARDDHGRIVAERADYEAVFAIAAPVFGAIAAEGVTPAVRETVAAVKQARGVSDEPVRLGQITERLELDKASVSRRVAQAVKGGWLVNDEERRGRPAKLLLGERLPEERPALPAPAEIFDTPPAQQCNTPPGDADSAHHDTVNTIARGDATVVQHPQRSDATPPGSVATVAVPLHGGLQHFSPSTDADNGAVEGNRCAVASGGGQHFSPPRPASDDDAGWEAYWADFATRRKGGPIDVRAALEGDRAEGRRNW